jgi:hypothetical protein
MALQPLDRPVDSSHILRFRGTVTVSATPAATYPKANAEVPSDSLVGPGTGTPAGQYRAWVRFLLADATNPSNGLKKFPALVYDDRNLAGVAPHAGVPSVASATPGINVADLDIGDQTWAPNLHYAVSALDSKIVSVDITDARVLLDTLTSGLGLNTGLPVIALAMNILTGSGQTPLQSFDVDITFEIRQSSSR